jgi:hypothetical protein
VRIERGAAFEEAKERARGLQQTRRMLGISGVGRLNGEGKGGMGGI